LGCCFSRFVFLKRGYSNREKEERDASPFKIGEKEQFFPVCGISTKSCGNEWGVCGISTKVCGIE
jgi:hypothetical protein